MAKKLKKKIKTYPKFKTSKVKSYVTADRETRAFIEFSNMLRKGTSEEKEKIQHRTTKGLPDLDFFSKKLTDIQMEARALRPSTKKSPVVLDFEGLPIEVTSFGDPSTPSIEIELGSRVNLTSNRYPSSRANPRLNSLHACEGTVVELFNEDACSVNWDNGCTNEYRMSIDLSPADAPPNKTLNIRYLKTNDRVKLTALTKYTPSYDNPVVTSEYECEGIVTYGGKQSNFCDVLWDNGKGNSYDAADLSLVNSETENCKSIW